jgi:3-oxoacid CoA-transferase
MRAHAAGIPAFFTPTGASTAVEEGSIPIRFNDGGMKAGVKIPGNKKETREFNGRKYVMEPAIAGDVAFVRAWKVDEIGNTVFRSVVWTVICALYINDCSGTQRITLVPLWPRTRN